MSTPFRILDSQQAKESCILLARRVQVRHLTGDSVPDSPLETETDVGSASRWNALRTLRVLRWYNNSTW
jgi:hypothetical protein